MFALLATLLLGCSGEHGYIVEGTVLEGLHDGRILVDHEEIPGFMGPMVMPFEVPDASVAADVKPGDRIVARLMVDEKHAWIASLRVTGHPGLPAPTDVTRPEPVRAAELFPRVDVPVNGGEVWVLGEGQPLPTVVAFLYTRCPLPEFCPLTVSRLQALQGAVGKDARLLAVTLDPEHDTLDVLADFAGRTGADPAVWRYGRLEGDALKQLAARAGLSFSPDGATITHTLRMLVLDKGGRLVERYDDNAWPLDRVVEQLRTGGPPAPAGTSGTLSAPPKP